MELGDAIDMMSSSNPSHVEADINLCQVLYTLPGRPKNWRSAPVFQNDLDSTYIVAIFVVISVVPFKCSHAYWLIYRHRHDII